ncbi:hypothetical protein LJR175_008437 [Variovorax sp. LjRoot175]|uniref:hypothetical protein n=1 Tax=Variovorax sp. LjRoot175 TaxID=3342276 RepID=UPI003ED0A85B
MAINASFAAVTVPLYRIAEAACHRLEEPPLLQSQAETALKAVVNKINESGLLLDAKYNLLAERVVRTFHGAAVSDCYASCSVSLYISQLSQFVTDTTREQILPGESASRIAQPGETLAPLPWTMKAITESGTKAYFRENFITWVRVDAAPPKTHSYRSSSIDKRGALPQKDKVTPQPVDGQQICRRKAPA